MSQAGPSAVFAGYRFSHPDCIALLRHRGSMAVCGTGKEPEHPDDALSDAANQTILDRGWQLGHVGKNPRPATRASWSNGRQPSWGRRRCP